LFTSSSVLGVWEVADERDTPGSIAARLHMPVTDFLLQAGAAWKPGDILQLDPPSPPIPPKLFTKYLEFYRVQKGDTLVSIAKKIGMTPEELADFNSIPRRYHLVLRGESLPQIAQRYKKTIAPFATANVSIVQVLQQWNNLEGIEKPSEGTLLTVGWEEPREGEKLGYPLLKKITQAVADELEKVYGPGKFWDDENTYEVYVVEEGDSLTSLAKKFATTAQLLADANGIEVSDSLLRGQPLFVPVKDTTIPSALTLFIARAKRATVLLPDPRVQSDAIRIKEGELIYVFGKTVGSYRPVFAPDREVDRAWLWVKDAHLASIDYSRAYFAPGIPAPISPQPSPPQERSAVLAAIAYIGVPYRYGGNSANGIDDPALVRDVLVNTGISPTAPRSLIALNEAVRKPARQKEAPLVLTFDTRKKGFNGPNAPGVPDHAGIYVGGGKFIHSTPPGVTISNLTGKYAKSLCYSGRESDAS